MPTSDRFCSVAEGKNTFSTLEPSKMYPKLLVGLAIVLSSHLRSVLGNDRPPAEDVSSILNSIGASAKSTYAYDKRVRPGYDGPPTVVNVTMYILSISAVSELNMDFTLDFYMQQSWVDRRLAFSHPNISQ